MRNGPMSPAAALQTQFLATYDSEEAGWRGGKQPYGPLSLLPSSQALNYGQSIFEGLKVGRLLFLFFFSLGRLRAVGKYWTVL